MGRFASDMFSALKTLDPLDQIALLAFFVDDSGIIRSPIRHPHLDIFSHMSQVDKALRATQQLNHFLCDLAIVSVHTLAEMGTPLAWIEISTVFSSSLFFERLGHHETLATRVRDVFLVLSREAIHSKTLALRWATSELKRQQSKTDTLFQHPDRLEERLTLINTILKTLTKPRSP